MSPLTLTDGWRYWDGDWKIDNTLYIEEAVTAVQKGLIEVPESIKVSSNGEAAKEQSNKMGIYKLQDEYRNNFPVWKKEDDDWFLFVSSNKFWSIGNDLNSTAAWIYNNNRNPTPISPLNLTDGWRYWDDDWKTDNTLYIEEAVTVPDPDPDSGPDVILIQSEGGAAEWQGDVLGYFNLLPDQLNSRPTYKQRGADNFIYFTSGHWYVWDKLGEDDGWLHVASDAILPPISSSSTPWRYWKEGAWAVDDPSLELLYDPVEDDSCSTVTVSSSGPAGRTLPDYMGTYEWTKDWQAGRKLYSNGNVFLRIKTGNTQWGIGREKNTGGSSISGGKATTCPCNQNAGTSVRLNRKWWNYNSGGEWNDKDDSIRIEC